MLPAMKLIAVVASARNGCIGINGRMPWHLSEDLKRFKQLTMGKTVLMGRKTFESILDQLGKPLPGRPQIVLTRDASWHPGVIGKETITRAKDVADALEMARARGLDELWVIGGAEIYKQLLDQFNVIELTEVDATVEGDAHLPALDDRQWAREIVEDGLEENGLRYRFVRLTRVKS